MIRSFESEEVVSLLEYEHALMVQAWLKAIIGDNSDGQNRRID
jgi:hypothetical protein